MKPRTSCFALLFVVAMITGLAAVAAAETPAFAYLGLSGESLTTLEVDNGGPYALGPDGFFLYDTTAKSWTPFTEPGQSGRRVTAITSDAWLDVPAVAGRLDADGHGYLTVEPLDGTVGTTTYVSTGGEVVTFALDFRTWSPYGVDLWAVTRAGEGSGELLFSDDSGVSWTAVGGHGMTDLTGVAVDSRYHQVGIVYVAGDGGVVRSLDGGATWESYATGLPSGAVTSLQAFGPTTADVGKAEGPEAGRFLATTASGLYQRDIGDADVWELVLAEDCARVETTDTISGSETVIVLTTDRRLLAVQDPPSSGAWTMEDWSDAFPLSTPVDIVAATRIYVATTDAGVYVTDDETDVPAQPAALTLHAAPTPFNPATTIHFTAPRSGKATLDAYDLLGRRVARLLDGDEVSEGPNSMPWRPKGLASGVYLLRLELGSETITQRVILAK